jgi:hypothetical protein
MRFYGWPDWTTPIADTVQANPGRHGPAFLLEAFRRAISSLARLSSLAAMGRAALV